MAADNPVNNIDPDGLNWYRNNKTGEVYWLKGNGDVDGHTNMGAYYIHKHNGNKVYHIQNQVVSAEEYYAAMAPATIVQLPFDPFRSARANTQAGLGRQTTPSYMYHFADKTPEYWKNTLEGVFAFEAVAEKGMESVILYAAKKSIGSNAKKMTLEDIGKFLGEGSNWHKTSAKRDFLSKFRKALKGDTNADFWIDKVTKEVLLKSNQFGHWIKTGIKFE